MSGADLHRIEAGPIYPRIVAMLRRHVGPVIPIGSVTRIVDLGIDNLATIDIACAIEEEFGPSMLAHEIAAAPTVAGLVCLVEWAMAVQPVDGRAVA